MVSRLRCIMLANRPVLGAALGLLVLVGGLTKPDVALAQQCGSSELSQLERIFTSAIRAGASAVIIFRDEERSWLTACTRTHDGFYLRGRTEFYGSLNGERYWVTAAVSTNRLGDITNFNILDANANFIWSALMKGIAVCSANPEAC